MTKVYAQLEQKVLDLFPEGQVVKLNGVEFKVLVSGKPRTMGRGGEPKTDCYIEIINIQNNQKIVYKISCKMKGKNEFVENKIGPERAENIFGSSWAQVIESASRSLENKFEDNVLTHPEGRARTKSSHLIIGWKAEISNKPRTLGIKIELSNDEIRDYIYKGVNQPLSRRDAKVGEVQIKESGVAEYILDASIESISSPSDVLNLLQKIDNYDISDHYLIFTSNAYRIKSGKTDGNRYLAVRVEWSADSSGKLVSNIKFDNPLVPPSKSSNMKNLVDIAFSNYPILYEEYYK